MWYIGLILIFILTGCDSTPRNSIDGSSVEKYQASLSRMLSETSKENRDEILFILEEDYKNFIEEHPYFVMPGQKSDARPPEYLAKMHGKTFEYFYDNARKRIDYKIKRANEKKEYKDKLVREAKAKREKKNKEEQIFRQKQVRKRIIYENEIAELDTIRKNSASTSAQLEEVARQIYDIERKCFQYVSKETITSILTARGVELKPGQPYIDISKDRFAVYGSQPSPTIKFPVEIRNKGRAGIWNVYINYKVFENERSIPWLNEDNYVSFTAGLDAGESINEIFSPLFLATDNRIFTLLKKSPKKLRIEYTVLSASIEKKGRIDGPRIKHIVETCPIDDYADLQRKVKAVTKKKNKISAKLKNKCDVLKRENFFPVECAGILFGPIK